MTHHRRYHVSLAVLVLGLAQLGLSEFANARTEQISKLLASDGATDDQFGGPISASGNSALVGAHHDDDAGSKSGAVYAFERQGDGNWTESQKLAASDAAAQDWFGWSVGVSGDWALVGAIGDDDLGSGSGSTYVFERQGDGSWLETQKLAASDGITDDVFGWSVAVEDGIALVGAPYDDDLGVRSGSVYAFERQGDGSWIETQKLVASDGAAVDQFGTSVAVSGDWAVIAAHGADDKGLNSGAVYFFERQGDGSWLETQKLVSSDGNAGDHFGAPLVLAGDVALAAALGDDDQGTDAGAVYVFERQGDGSWLETQKLVSSAGAADDEFGSSIAISGTRTLVGASGDDELLINRGAAYAFERQGDGTWLETQKLGAEDAAERDTFGDAVALLGDVALIGATGDDDLGISSGSLYQFDFRFTRYDAGCPGSTMTAPTLLGSGDPFVGGSLTVSIEQGPALAPGILFVGLFQVDLPIGFDCSLLVSPLALQLPLNLSASGAVSFTAAVPGFASPGAITMQALFGDLLVPGGFASTNGLQVEISP